MAAEAPRRMDISIRHKDFKLVLMCKNTCAHDVLFENGLPRRKSGSGVGVSSIQLAAGKYHGNTMFSAEEGTFTAIVLLNET